MQDHSNHLTLAKRRLLELMTKIGYGRIEGFPVVNGEPVLVPPPRVVYELRVPAGANAPRPCAGGFTPKAAVAELLQLFTRLECAWVAWVEIRNGLPTRVAVTDRDDSGRQNPTRDRDSSKPFAPESRHV